MSKSWLVISIQEINDALTGALIAIGGFLLLGLELGLGFSFMSRAVDGRSILNWALGGLCLALALWMRPIDVKLLGWGSCFALLACSFWLA